MTQPDRPDPSTFDLPFDLARARMAELRSAAARPVTSRDAPGSATRLREVIGRGLIALGSSLVPDERERRRTAVG